MQIAMYIGLESHAARIAELLAAQGCGCELFASAGAIMRAAHYGGYDLIVMELRGDREEQLSWVRCRASNAAPVVLISGDPSSDHVIRAFEAGADDVLARPFVDAELVARVRAVHRRARRARGDSLRVDLAGFSLDHESSRILDRGVPIELTPREFAIAWFLFTSPGAFARRDAITMAVWGQGTDIAGRTLEQHIHRLRKKLGLSTERGVIIQAAYGRGYRLEVCAAARPSTAVATSFRQRFSPLVLSTGELPPFFAPI